MTACGDAIENPFVTTTGAVEAPDVPACPGPGDVLTEEITTEVGARTAR